jgi:2-polyprenyl-3-methyl-5-hydroxy-6-metoxy-1,4-benzoquinol methylase
LGRVETVAGETSSSSGRLSENDIRPEHLNFEKDAAYARDVARLLTHQAEFVVVPCPACGEEKPREKWRKHQLTYQECETCKTIYVSPRPPPHVVDEYYATSELYEYWNKHIFPASETVRRERIFRPRVRRLIDLCDKYGVSPRVLVEVGAGFGSFCEEAKASGRFERIVAIEPTPSLAETCRRRGVEVIDQPIERVDLHEVGVDVLASFEVIEHLFEPFGFVKACATAVKQNGLLVLTCPNGQGFEVQVLGTTADTVDTEHLNYFNPESLARLVQRAGFEVLEVLTPGVLDADIVRNKVLAGKFDLSGQRFLQMALLERWTEVGGPFQDFLRENKLSSHMWLVARKP